MFLSSTYEVGIFTLSESEQSIRSNASKLNLELNNLNFLDLSPESRFFTELESYDIFSPAEVEREPVTKKIVEHPSGQ